MGGFAIALLALLICAAFGFSAVKAIGSGELHKEGMEYVSRLENPVVFWRLVAWRGLVASTSSLLFAYACFAALVSIGVWKIEL